MFRIIFCYYVIVPCGVRMSYNNTLSKREIRKAFGFIDWIGSYFDKGKKIGVANDFYFQ